MKVRWTFQAAEDLEEIRSYLLRERPALAQSTLQKLYAAALSLRHMPLRGRAGAKPNTLELLLLPLPYVIIYRAQNNVVEILGFRHTSREVSVH